MTCRNHLSRGNKRSRAFPRGLPGGDIRIALLDQSLCLAAEAMEEGDCLGAGIGDPAGCGAQPLGIDALCHQQVLGGGVVLDGAMLQPCRGVTIDHGSCSLGDWHELQPVGVVHGVI